MDEAAFLTWRDRGKEAFGKGNAVHSLYIPNIYIDTIYYLVSMIKPPLHDDWKAFLKLCLITTAANLPGMCRTLR